MLQYPILNKRDIMNLKLLKEAIKQGVGTIREYSDWLKTR